MSSVTKPKSDGQKPRPALQVQVGGVRIPIWRNASEGGPAQFRAGQPELSYKGTDDKWHQTKAYSPGDLINLIKAAALAHSELVQRDRAEQTKEAPVPSV